MRLQSALRQPHLREVEGTRIADRVTIGSHATILAVNICSGAVIGAGAVVTRDIEIPGTYAGNPARLIRAFE